MDVRDHLRTLRRQWLLVVACLLLGVAAAAIVTIRSTPVYSSTARLFISTPTSADANADAYQGALFSQQRVASYADLIGGTTVAQKVIDKLQLEESATALSGQITARAVPTTVILEVTVNDSNAGRAHQLAQTLAEVFVAYVPELESATDPGAAPIKAVISDAAVLPTSPVSPRPLVNIGLGAVLGLLVGLGLATLRERLDTTVKSPDELQAATGAASLGLVHFDAGAVRKPLITDLSSHSPRLESIRVLRTNLQFLDVDHQSSVIAITSPLPGDGKSTTAVNLAISLAQAGQRVLLLEADLRRPRVAEYLGLESTVGLTTLLVGRATIDDVLQPFAQAPGLDVITSGAIPPNPAELLQSATMKTLIAELRSRYDMVLVDSPPILPVTDAALLGAITDGAVLVAHHGKTTREQAARARQRLESVEAQLLGTVLNFVPDKGSARYGYGYGYGYGSGPVVMTAIGEDLRPPDAVSQHDRALSPNGATRPLPDAPVTFAAPSPVRTAAPAQAAHGVTPGTGNSVDRDAAATEQLDVTYRAAPVFVPPRHSDDLQTRRGTVGRNLPT